MEHNKAAQDTLTCNEAIVCCLRPLQALLRCMVRRWLLVPCQAFGVIELAALLAQRFAGCVIQRQPPVRPCTPAIAWCLEISSKP